MTEKTVKAILFPLADVVPEGQLAAMDVVFTRLGSLRNNRWTDIRDQMIQPSNSRSFVADFGDSSEFTIHFKDRATQRQLFRSGVFTPPAGFGDDPEARLTNSFTGFSATQQFALETLLENVTLPIVQKFDDGFVSEVKVLTLDLKVMGRLFKLKSHAQAFFFGGWNDVDLELDFELQGVDVYIPGQEQFLQVRVKRFDYRPRNHGYAFLGFLLSPFIKPMIEGQVVTAIEASFHDAILGVLYPTATPAVQQAPITIIDLKAGDAEGSVEITLSVMAHPWLPSIDFRALCDSMTGARTRDSA